MLELGQIWPEKNFASRITKNNTYFLPRLKFELATALQRDNDRLDGSAAGRIDKNNPFENLKNSAFSKQTTFSGANSNEIQIPILMIQTYVWY